jgi:flagellar hook-associated protein 1 FlgK
MGIASLEIGKRALLAQRLGLDVTSNNIANVNTTGYSRRTANTAETDPQYTNAGFVGTGALVDKLRSFREEFFDREIRSNLSRQKAYENDEKIIHKIESIIAEPSDTGINEIVSEFYNSFESLAIEPENTAQREYVISVGETLVQRFNRTGEQFESMRSDILVDINNDVVTANRLISEIAELNQKVSDQYSQDGSGSQTMIDEREVRLENLSEIASVAVTSGDFGMVNVFVGGINVVTNNVTTNLKAIETITGLYGERSVSLVTVDNDDNTLNTVNPEAGILSSNIKHFNETLDPYDTSENFSLYARLNRYAEAIVKNTNEVFNQGYGVNDFTEPPPGRNFFEPGIEPATALNISISRDIADPLDLPLSDAPGEIGNAEIAMRVARISTDTSFLDAMTPTEYYSGLLGRIGQISNESVNGAKTTRLVSEQLSNQRESVIGVNLDEEAINLIKYQKAFEAASRVVNTTNEILATIINLGR